VKVSGVPTAPDVDDPLVMAGAELTVRVSVWMAFGSMPLLAVIAMV
jgi:hypothetical protein